MNCIKIIAPLILVVCSSVFAEDYKVSTQEGRVGIPVPTGIADLNTPALEEKIWWRGVSGSFEVISLDNNKGKLIENQINQLKSQAILRWGLPQTELTLPVRVLVVPSKEMMKKLFKIDESRIEPFRNYNGEDLHVMYVVADDTVENAINPVLTGLMLAELGKLNSLHFPFWVHRGMGTLSLSPNKLRNSLVQNRVTQSSIIFSTTAEGWRKLDPSKRELFDIQCAVLCLLLRKEFGQNNFHKFLISGASSEGIKEVYKFRNDNQFDSSYQRFASDLNNSLAEKKVPDTYLQITPVEK